MIPPLLFADGLEGCQEEALEIPDPSTLCRHRHASLLGRGMALRVWGKSLGPSSFRHDLGLQGLLWALGEGNGLWALEWGLLGMDRLKHGVFVVSWDSLGGWACSRGLKSYLTSES